MRTHALVVGKGIKSNQKRHETQAKPVRRRGAGGRSHYRARKKCFWREKCCATACGSYLYRVGRPRVAVCPEAVDTEMGAGFKDNTTQEAMQKIYPLGMLEAEDVADTIIFLLSDMSKKITGQSIWLSAGNDGGSIDGHIL